MARKRHKPVHEFTSYHEWEQWLLRHATRSDGIWLRIFHADGPVPSISYDEAASAALAYRWRGGQKRMYDEHSWIQLFRPTWAHRPARRQCREDFGNQR